MTSITTKIVKDGNSMAVRLPKALLAMSGLHDFVQIEAKKGQITIKQETRPSRDGWEEQIGKLVANHGDPGAEFQAWQETNFTAADNLAWNGPTYQEWLKQNAKN